MDPHTDVPSMEVLRGKCQTTSAVLGLQFQPDPTSPKIEFLPFIIGDRVSIERSNKTKYIMRDVKLLWAYGAQKAHELMRGLARLGIAGNDGVYVGLSLALPDVVYTTHCLGRACRDCHLWDPCIDGGLPFGWFVHVTVEAYHLAKKFDPASDIGNPAKPIFRSGDFTHTLTVHGAALPREVLSFNKDLFLPQTWKSPSELRAEDQENPHDDKKETVDE